ncbi:aldo/keto reductase [uncultured Microbulbifer sp.]|uniref:aldo/keto reductase n=1 Tax=uncultured Microbulbifer sp. TaxID=348147 RepID=UPI0025D9188B|nr:aldo/keto reductase [uncultured Microbulbifer sp.]
MHKRKLGKTGINVSEIGLGCWQLGGDFGPLADDRAGAILEAAAASGITFWDTADVYGGGMSEQRIGDFTHKPDGLIVATKVGRDASLYPDGYSLDGVRASLAASAQRLGVKTLDLAQLHCVPPAVLQQGDIFSWMETLKAEGLIHHWGASVETIDEANLCLQQPGLATLQIIFNIFRQDAAEALLNRAAENNVGIIVRLPLASGLLSGKFSADTRFDSSDHRNYNRDGAAFSVGETFGGIPFAKGVELVENLRRILGVQQGDSDMASLALRWILDHPAVSTVIVGASSPQQVAGNAAASERPALDSALHKQLAEFYRGEVRSHIRGDI